MPHRLRPPACRPPRSNLVLALLGLLLLTACESPGHPTDLDELVDRSELRLLGAWTPEVWVIVEPTDDYTGADADTCPVFDFEATVNGQPVEVVSRGGMQDGLELTEEAIGYDTEPIRRCDPTIRLRIPPEVDTSRRVEVLLLGSTRALTAVYVNPEPPTLMVAPGGAAYGEWVYVALVPPPHEPVVEARVSQGPLIGYMHWNVTVRDGMFWWQVPLETPGVTRLQVTVPDWFERLERCRGFRACLESEQLDQAEAPFLVLPESR